jgi:hypothetical protein
LRVGRQARRLFVVRATLADPAKRGAFDAWYSREHLPDAVKSFGAAKAWRYWAESEASLHIAMYQFPDSTARDRAIKGPELELARRDAPARIAGAGGGVWGVVGGGVAITTRHARA